MRVACGSLHSYYSHLAHGEGWVIDPTGLRVKWGNPVQSSEDSLGDQRLLSILLRV